MLNVHQPQNQIDLVGYNAVVTGGASGLGLAIATRLVQSGANVCIWDLSSDSIVRAVAALDSESRTTQRVAGLIGNVVSPESIDAALKSTEAQIGAVDILVNNAGISGPTRPSWEYQLDDWNGVLAVNLTGTFLVTRSVIPGMVERNYGRVVNVASIAGKEGNPNAVAYSSSKAGVIGFTKTLGKELADTSITVNCVTPAAVQTPIFEQMSQQHIDFMLSKIPMGRFGQPEEVAALVAWLASPECSFSTGAVFDLSGGRATY